MSAERWSYDMPMRSGELPLSRLGEDCYCAYLRHGKVTVAKFFMPCCGQQETWDFYWQRLKLRCEIVCSALNAANCV